MPEEDSGPGEGQAYLDKLLSKHFDKAGLAQQMLHEQNSCCEDHIISGRYRIQEQPVKVSAKVKSQHHSAVQIRHNKQVQRQLQDRLEQLQEDMQGLSSSKDSKPIPEGQRIEFVKKLEKQRRDIARRVEEKARAAQSRLLAQENQTKTELQLQESQRKQKKKKQLAEKLQLMESSRSKQEDLFKQQNKLLKQKMNEKILLEKMQDKYNQTQNMQLEERKKKLAEIRAFHRPLERADLDEHTKKISQLREERKTQQQTSLPSSPKVYKSSWYFKVKDEKREQDRAQSLEQMKEVKDKLKKYALNVREHFKPEIDEQKVEQRMKNLKNKETVYVEPAEARKIGMQYLEYSKTHNDPKKTEAESSKTEEPELPAKIDYLTEQRKLKRTAATAQEILQRIEKDSSLSKAQKVQKILQYAERLQERAKRKEQVDKVRNNGIDDELDILYLQAIEAKLRLLQ